MVSRIPPASPAAIMFTNSSSNALGCLRIASARVVHVLQRGRLRGAVVGVLRAGLLGEMAAGDGLVEGLHPVFLLAGLHGRVDLVDLVLAEEVPDGGVWDEKRHSEAAPSAARLGQ